MWSSVARPTKAGSPRSARAYSRPRCVPHLLGGDAIVADARLDQARALAESDPQSAWPGRCPTTSALPSRVEPPPDAMDRFARRWRAAHLGQWSLVEGRSGTCLLMKRRVLEGIGGLGEGPGPGSLGDLTAWARRADAPAVAHDLFVLAGGSCVRRAADRGRGGGPTRGGRPKARWTRVAAWYVKIEMKYGWAANTPENPSRRITHRLQCVEREIRAVRRGEPT
ncbi:MAG: hypothetical protein WKF75_02410 [Singulisphaera sp.]